MKGRRGWILYRSKCIKFGLTFLKCPKVNYLKNALYLINCVKYCYNFRIYITSELLYLELPTESIKAIYCYNNC